MFSGVLNWAVCALRAAEKKRGCIYVAEKGGRRRRKVCWGRGGEVQLYFYGEKKERSDVRVCVCLCV